MKFRFAILLALAAAMIFAVGCSDDDPVSSNGTPQNTNSTEWNDAGYWVTANFDASNYTDYNFYSFTDRDPVELTLDEAQNSSAWDIGLGRVNVLINSGGTGPGTAMAVDLAELDHSDSTDFEGFSDRTTIDDSALDDGSVNLIIDEWFVYNPVTHGFDLTNYVYIMRDAEENYVKFQVAGMDDISQTDMGTITIQYIFSGVSPDLSGTPDTLIFDAMGMGPIYVDFSAGVVTAPADPENSLEWDIVFENFEIHQNNSIWGSGAAGTYEVWVDQTDPTDFNEIVLAPVAAPYFSDQFGSPLTDWYLYQHPNILSLEHVYLIKSGEAYYKFQILSYYNSDDATSAFYTFRWVEME